MSIDSMENWHYSRDKLARHYLSMLDVGIMSYLGLAAIRRKGKTFFILNDFAPMALKQGYLPVYATLWQNLNAPHEPIIQALSEALDAIDSKRYLNNLLKTKVKKAKLSNELLGSMEVEFASSPTPATSQDLNRVDALLGQLVERSGKKKVILLIDEIQHLATSSKFDPLSASLRSVLDKRQGSVKAIFTGSS